MFDGNNKKASESFQCHCAHNLIVWLSLIISLAALTLSSWQFFSANRQNAADNSGTQAHAVSAFIKEDTEDYSTAALDNLSNAPVYDVVITVVSIGNSGDYAQDGKSVRKSEGMENGALLTILPPGKYKVKMPAIGHGMSQKFGVEIAFRDCNNNSWIITADGHLHRIDSPPLKYYNLPGPNDFSKLEDYS